MRWLDCRTEAADASGRFVSCGAADLYGQTTLGSFMKPARLVERTDLVAYGAVLCALSLDLGSFLLTRSLLSCGADCACLLCSAPSAVQHLVFMVRSTHENEV